MNKELLQRTEDTLAGYKALKAEIENLKLYLEEIEEEYKGCSAAAYEEGSGSSNKFNSVVENEIISKEELKHQIEYKERFLRRIDNALSTLKEIDYTIIKLKYIDKLSTWDVVGNNVNLTGDYCRAKAKPILNTLSEIIFVVKSPKNHRKITEK